MFRMFSSTRFTVGWLQMWLNCMSCLQVHFITLQSKSSGNRGREGHSILLNGTGVQKEIIPYPYLTSF